jgi:hypothetical protein
LSFDPETNAFSGRDAVVDNNGVVPPKFVSAFDETTEDIVDADKEDLCGQDDNEIKKVRLR